MHLPTAKRPWGRDIFIVLLLILTLIGGMSLKYPVRLQLLHNAHRIADVSACKRWWWLDAHRIFIIEVTASHLNNAFILDSTATQKIPLSNLNRTFMTLGSKVRYELS